MKTLKWPVDGRGRRGGASIVLIVVGLAMLPGCRSRPLSAPARSVLAALPYLRDGVVERQSSADPGLSNADELELAPGAAVVLARSRGPGVIRRVWIATDTPAASSGSRDGLVLRGWFDGASSPCIDVPFDVFFGTGLTAPEQADTPLRVTSDGRSMSCLFAMPFHRSARLEIRNDSRRTWKVLFQVDIEHVESLPHTAAIFHAAYRQEFPCRSGLRYPVLEARGQGHYVGCSLTVQTTMPGWWGEGDEIVTLDGDAAMPLLGTGTDNYFARAEHMAQPPTDPASAGAPAGTITRLRRLQIEDPIPFHTGISVEFEHWGRVFDDRGRLLGNGERRDNYSSVAYWYQTEPHMTPPEVPPLDDRCFPEIEPEARFEALGPILVTPRPDDALARDGSLELRRREPLLFGCSQSLRLRALRSGASLSLEVEVRQAGPYDLLAELVLAPDCGIYEVRLDGRLLFGGIDGYAAHESRSAPVHLGRTDLASGRHDLEFVATGRSMYSSGYDIEIIRLRLQELR